MGLRARWTEEQFEEWFKARFDRWINERFSGEFDERLNAWVDNHLQDKVEALFASRFDDRMQAWADGQFRARFDAGFNSRINAWKDTELKKGFDAWIENWFDNLFTVWANTWADSADFRERFVQNFAAQFHDRLDTEVKARVANEVNGLIDRRIETWLLAVRLELLEVAPPDAPTQPGNEVTQQLPSSDGHTPPAEAVATAAELAEYLARGPLGPGQIRKILKGKEIPGRSPNAYPLGDAAAALLTRKGRQAKTSEPDAPQRHRNTGGD
ncbi:hypothetical protein [Nonomuraea endophytica]|uniref:hypothetical protein n=1 Tax=Nonomuraea endophytica TaxID=714136 RepID=UPI0037C8DA6C